MILLANGADMAPRAIGSIAGGVHPVPIVTDLLRNWGELERLPGASVNGATRGAGGRSLLRDGEVV